MTVQFTNVTEAEMGILALEGPPSVFLADSLPFHA